MNKDQPLNFTCKRCGSHHLNVYRVWNILAGPESETWQEWGQLEADHLWDFEFKEKIQKKQTNNDLARRDLGAFAEDNATSKPEDYEIFERHNNPGNDQFYVNCAGCDREIEFGWERPNRIGGIFPVECADFVPENIWPEPRYLDFWHKQGWLNPEESRS